jgi:xanthine dehydrogenase accessory factor
MDSLQATDQQVLTQARAWLDEGRTVYLAWVVRTWGSSPRPPGSVAAIRDDGAVVGSVSGGCIEDDLISRIRAGKVNTLRPSLAAWGVDKDEATRFGLPCGGELHAVIEPLRDPAAIRPLIDAIDQRQQVVRQLSLASGKTSLRPARCDEAIRFDGTHLSTVHGPRWRLVVIGAGQISAYLAGMAGALGFDLAVCDPREEYWTAWPHADLPIRREMPDDLVIALQPDERTAVVALTHDPKLDDLALLEALKSRAFYVGALGSSRTNHKRRERLALFDLTPAQIARLHGPVGLPLGSRTPPEIALAILAEITAIRNGVSTAHWTRQAETRAINAS